MFSILLTILLAGFQARSAPPVRASIEGTVIRAGAIAGAPRRELTNVRVELRPGSSTYTTGPGGIFSFRNLAPGQYTIFFTRDGFIPQEDRGRGITPAGLRVTLTAGQVMKDVVLPMIPAPVITGRVFDPHGDTLAASLVRAYRRQFTPYGTQLRVARKIMTNDLGEFRLFDLSFANYLISGGYGDRDRAAALGRVQLSANVSKADEGYVTVFYDGGDDLTRATPVRLAPGAETPSLNIYLTESARYKIRGQITPMIGGSKILLAPKGSDLSEANFFTSAGADGMFEIRGVSPGSYVLLATADGGAWSSDVVPILVSDRDVDGVRVALAETMPVTGRLSFDSSGGTVGGNLGVRVRLTSGIRVKLIRSSVEFAQEFETYSLPDATFTLEHVAPLAEYDVAIEPLPQGSYVKSIYSGGTSVLQGKARLAPLQSLSIVLAVASDGLDVRVTRNADSAAGIQVVLIPEPAYRRRADRYVTGFTDQSGFLQLSAVPPGRYTAYAFEHIAPDAYYVLGYSPGAESRFRDRAVNVTIGENGPKSIQLTVIAAAETADLQ
jgi:hypothetical protein